MKRILVLLFVVLGCVSSWGKTLYVDGDNRSPVAPYTNWATAAGSIQDAIDAAVDGDVVLVTNGTYFTGYTTWMSDVRTRVVVSNEITVQSVNGPEVTTIRGLGPSGPTAVRCVYLASNAVLSGFTLSDGHTRITGDLESEQCGGGVWGVHDGGTVSNCYLVDCNANEGGGGARGGVFFDSVFTNCQAKSGGGAYNAEMTRCQVLYCRALTGNGGGLVGGGINHCLIQGNRSELGDGGGMYGGVAGYTTFRWNEAGSKGGAACGSWQRNCVYVENSAVYGGAVGDIPFYDPPVYYSTFIRNRAVAGGASMMINVVRCVLIENEASLSFDNVCMGWATHCFISDQYMDFDYNYGADPLVAGLDNPHLLAASPVIDFMVATNNYAPYDIDGETRINGTHIDAGCDEFWASGMTGALSAVVSYYESDVSVGFNARFEGTVYGKPESIWWDWGDGTVTSNLCMASHCYTSPGDYEVAFGGSNLDGATAVTVSVHVVSVVTNYVSLTGSHTPPFSSWASAATTIQDAVDAQVVPGSVVMVADGVYSVGETVATGDCPNRVALTNQVTLRSLNGPDDCVIQGAGPLGEDALRCLYVGNDAVVDGFTIENGHTLSNGSEYVDSRGGGACCERYGLLTNCIVRSCRAAKYGGGVYKGRVYSSVIVSNEAISTGSGAGGGASGAYLSECSLSYNQALSGGGAYLCMGSHNTVVNNRANNGGGASSCLFRQSLVRRNIAYSEGGGAILGGLDNCVVVENQAAEGGGVSSTEMRNSIVYYNKATLEAPDFLDDERYPHPVYHSCVSVEPPKGSGNITNEPGLCGLSNPHILADSVCRNMGTNCAWMTTAVDIDGESRLEGSLVDIGCDEYHAAGVTGPVEVAITLGASKVVAGYELSFEAATTGRIERLEWNFDDGSAVVTNVFLLGHTFAAIGSYDVVLSAFYDGGVAACTSRVDVVAGFTNYVSRTGTGLSPYTSWVTAARNIQDAVDANGTAGGVVMVGPNTYDSGGAVHWGGTITSRVVLVSGMRLISRDGPETTIIEGVTNQGPAAVRCVFLGEGASIEGFTLRNGGTSIDGGWLDDCSGAGVLGQIGTLVSNCWIEDCHARQYGGGAVLASLVDCRLTGNTASNGAGMYYGTLTGCALQSNVAEYGAGAAYGSVAMVCTMEYNRAVNYGGAMMYGRADNCELNENWTWGYGGGACHVDLEGCMLFSNVTRNVGGGSFEGVASNCVYLQNGSVGHGGAVYMGTFYDCSFIANTAAVAGVGDYAALYNCQVVSNSAVVAGALFEGYAERCVFRGNRANLLAGANYGGTNRNCWLTGNYSAREGGAVYGTLLENCTVVSNVAADIGGGISGARCINSIVRYNYISTHEANYNNSSFDHSFTYPMPTTGQNYTDDPGIVGWDNPRLLSNSPCINAGFVTNWMTNAVDLYGEARLHDGQVDVGCAEFHASTRTGTLSAVIFALPSRVIAGNPVQFVAVIEGQPLGLDWNFGGLASEDLLFNPSQSFGMEGTHDVVLQIWNEDGLFAVTSQIYVAGGFTNYVAPGGGNIYPYTNWAMAANSIQDAITANDVAGGVVMVSNGVYDSGKIAVTNGMDNRVVVTNPVVIRSVNGPAVTIIEGNGVILGANAVRCLYMMADSELHGFTVTNGVTHLLGDPETELRGGGIWCENNSVLISNCVISGCKASSRGGGVYRGQIKNSVLSGNSVVWYGGATHMADLEDCLVADNSSDLAGGGLSEGTARRCIIRGNKALADVGGGSYYSSIYNCQVYSNEAFLAGGIYLGSAYHCTIVSNWARDGGGGSYDTSLRNCIVYYNQANSGEQNVEHGMFGSTKYSCATPLKSGTGNITNAPLLENLGAFDLRIQTNSPCIDAGSIEYQTTDDYVRVPRPLDGNDNGIALPDMGAYEVICDAADSDGDFYRDGDEFVAGTDPVDADSYFAMIGPVVELDDIIMQWQTVTGRLYSVMYSTNLAESSWANVPGYVDLPGDGGMLVITNAMGTGQCEFYRVEVEKE